MFAVDNISSREDWPETVNVTYSQSRSVFITDMRRELSASIINAVILVFIVCIAALGWRSALFVGWAIPASFLIAFFLFYIQGETLNMMILFGLILSVGVLVDSAIVIVEYADRKMDEGLPRRLGAIIGFKPKKKENSNAALLAGADGDPSKLSGFTGAYVKLIRQLIRFPLLVLLALGILGFVIRAAFISSVEGPPPKPVEFFTQTSGDQVYILARTRGNSTPTQSLSIAEQLENKIVKVDGVASLYTVVGPGAAGNGSAGAGLNGPSNVKSWKRPAHLSPAF